MILVGTLSAAVLESVSLPPPQYDYVPESFEVRHVPMNQIRDFCGTHAAGCAAVKEHKCFIILPPRELFSAAAYERVLRHEYGHCNGWDHE
jgi:hypothetical protein